MQTIESILIHWRSQKSDKDNKCTEWWDKICIILQKKSALHVRNKQHIPDMVFICHVHFLRLHHVVTYNQTVLLKHVEGRVKHDSSGLERHVCLLSVWNSGVFISGHFHSVWLDVFTHSETSNLLPLLHILARFCSGGEKEKNNTSMIQTLLLNRLHTIYFDHLIDGFDCF